MKTKAPNVHYTNGEQNVSSFCTKPYMRPSQGFGDSGRRAIYFQGLGEKGHLFSGIWGESIVLGSREQGAEEKHFRELGRKVIFLSGSREQRPPPPLGRPHILWVLLEASDRCGNNVFPKPLFWEKIIKT